MRRGILMFSAVFGLVASLACAWLPRLPGFDTSIVTLRSGLAAESSFSNVFEQESNWTTWVMILPPANGLTLDTARAEAPMNRIDELPYWTAREIAGDDAFRIVTEATGWPMRCMSMTTRAYRDRPAAEYGVWRPFTSKPSSTAPGMFDGVGATRTLRGLALPIGVILPGLLVNFLFFAGLPLGLVSLRAWVIRRRRLADGLCTGCGYDRRAATAARCPECGEA